MINVTTPPRGIAFVADYLPRKCGIATFTHDLAESVAGQAGSTQPVFVVSMNDRPEGYAYSDRVKFEVRQDYQIDYSRAADFLNFGRADVVCVQHEYGIFGGEWGSNLLTLIRDLQRPFVMTCHTIIEKIDKVQASVFEELAARADRLVVMSERGVRMLQDIYDVPREKIALIPHGIHDTPFIDPSFYKDKFGVEGRNLLLTFGLLHRNKGLEHMIEALPEIVERHPRTTYLIVGQTHPNVVREEGESYRLSLQRRVRELGVEDNVLFHPRFVELDELLEYLGAADICVTPYLNIEQITSGALAYMLGAGKAVVSTPYWHAEELLADGRGVLVPLEDSKALSAAINGLLDDEVAMSAMRKKAYLHSRASVWSATARQYLQVFDEVRSHAPRKFPAASSLNRTLSASNLPMPKLDHLHRMMDDTGPARHARHTIPVWSSGYHLDDAAAVLVASIKFHRTLKDHGSDDMASTCLGLLQLLIGSGSEVKSGLDYSRHFLGAASDLDIARAMWALGYAVGEGDASLSTAADEMFMDLLGRAHPRSPAALSYAVLGAANYLIRFPGASDVRRFLTRRTAELMEVTGAAWLQRWEGPDWPVAAQALTIAGVALEDEDVAARAAVLVSDLLEATRRGTVFVHPGGGDGGDETERPVTASSFIDAVGAAYYAGHDNSLLEPMRAAADWFVGANSRGLSLYDFATGGCCDALSASGLNRNQGTEATAHCLIALLTLYTVGARHEGEGAARAEPEAGPA